MKKIIIISLFAAVVLIAFFVYLNLGDASFDSSSPRSSSPIASKQPSKISPRAVAPAASNPQSSTFNSQLSTSPTNLQLSTLKPQVPTNNPYVQKRGKQSFKSATEMILGRLFATKLGDPPPPLPQIPLGELKKIKEILTRPTEVFEHDSEQIREMKAAGDAAKKEFLEFLQKGGDDTEFIDYYQTKLRQYHERWREAHRTAIELAREGEVEAARQFVDETNKSFGNEGIKPIKLPPKWQQERN